LKGADVLAREQLQTLSEPMYFILLALTRPMHGYEIMQTISAISNDRVKVGAGTLYALLTRFEKEEIVIRISDDGRRKTYALTGKGRELLDREYKRLKESITAYDVYLCEGDKK
jgi:DNA-binding PadR family transcriptional regulator